MHYFHVRPTVRSSQDIQNAIVLVRDGDMPAAQQHLDTALQRASGSMVPPLATLLGGVEVELGNVERGLAILESVSDSGWLDREDVDHEPSCSGASPSHMPSSATTRPPPLH